MSFRFRRSIRLARGIRINLGLRGPSLSVGPRGLGLTVGPAGLTSHVGIPGTGLSYRETQRLTIPEGRLSGAHQAEITERSGVGIHLSLASDGRLCLTNADGGTLDPRIDRRLRESYHVQLSAWLDEQCKAVNDEADEIIHLHRKTQSPRQTFHFNSLPFAVLAPVEPPPVKLGWLDRLFRGRRRQREADNAASVGQYRAARQHWEAARGAHLAQQESMRHRWEDERLSSTDVMHELLEGRLRTINWPRETIVSFEVVDGGKALRLDVDLPEIEDMPTRSAEVAARGLKLNYHERSQIQVRREYMTHLHAVLFRVVGEAFATLPTVKRLECSGFSQRVDPVTGQEANDYLLSVRVERSKWEYIYVAQQAEVDPIDSLNWCELRRDCTASGIMRPITPFSVHANNA